MVAIAEFQHRRCTLVTVFAKTWPTGGCAKVVLGGECGLSLRTCPLQRGMCALCCVSEVAECGQRPSAVQAVLPAACSPPQQFVGKENSFPGTLLSCWLRPL